MTGTDIERLPINPLSYAQHMAISERQLLDALSRTPFVDSTELALILGEPHATVHRTLGNLLAEGIGGRVSHGTAHLPSSQRYHLTTKGIGETAWVLGFDTPSDFVRAYPASREWLTLLIRRMDAVASVYRLAASMSPGIDGLRSRVEFHRRGRFDATITLHDGRSFGIVRQGLALRRRSLYDRLRAIAGYDYTRRPSAVLILTPSSPSEDYLTVLAGQRQWRCSTDHHPCCRDVSQRAEPMVPLCNRRCGPGAILYACRHVDENGKTTTRWRSRRQLELAEPRANDRSVARRGTSMDSNGEIYP